MPKKITEMTEKELLAEIEANESKRQELFKKMKPIERSLTRLSKRNETLRDTISKYKALKIEKLGKVDWEWLLYTSYSDTSMEKFRLRDRELSKLNLTSNGFLPEINQVQIQVMLKRGDRESLMKTKRGLKKVLKYIKPIKGWKHINIAEVTCSQYGVYFMVISEDDSKIEIRQTVYHKTETLHKFDNLNDALLTIQERYYYE